MSLEHEWPHVDGPRKYKLQIMFKEDPTQQDIRANKIKEGFLIKRSRILKEWKKRWMVLTKTHLYSFENKGVYRAATEKIPLREVSTIKSFYKNQYERPQVFRIESDDTFFYLSASTHQEKWAWMTAVEKMTEVIKNPAVLDSQNLVRESLRMSNALRQSTIARKSFASSKLNESNSEGIVKRMNLSFKPRVIDCHFQLKDAQQYKLQTKKLQFLTLPGQSIQKPQKDTKAVQNKIVQRIVQKIVEVKIPVTVEKIVEKIVYIEQEARGRERKQSGEGLSDLFGALLNTKLDDPYPLLDFVAFLGLTGIEHYQTIAMKFCCEEDCQRFFAELLLQALNEETSQPRLNRYTGFIYILCQRQPDYFYISDLRIVLEIVLRELELFRSDLNQMINLQLLKTVVTYHQNLLTHKKDDIKAIVSEIATLGPTQNREVATEICLLIQ